MLPHDTSVADCRKAVDRVKGAIAKVEGVVEKTDVHFLVFNTSSLDFQVTYIDQKATAFDVQHEINLNIKEALESAGIGIAFPTVTIDAPELMLKAA